MENACKGRVINYLEHVEVKVNLNYSRRGDLEMKVSSPSGTVSNLTHFRYADSRLKNKELKNWVVMTLHLWGETAKGKWTLILKNSQIKRANKGFRTFHLRCGTLNITYCLILWYCNTMLWKPRFVFIAFNNFWVSHSKRLSIPFSRQGFLFDWTLILHGTKDNPLEVSTHVSHVAISHHSTDQPTKLKASRKTGYLPPSKVPSPEFKMKYLYAAIGLVIFALIICWFCWMCGYCWLWSNLCCCCDLFCLELTLRWVWHWIRWVCCCCPSPR